MKRAICFLLLALINTCFAQEDPRLWDEEGLPIRQGDHLEWRKSTAVNDEGYTCVVWSDARSGYWDVYAQLIAPDGRQLWSNEGIVVCDAEWRQEDAEVIAVDDGWIIAWMDWRYGDRFHGPAFSAVFAQKLSMNGQQIWNPEGVEIYADDDRDIRDLSIEIVPDEAGGAIIGWRWRESSVGIQFHTQHIQSDGSVDWTEPLTVVSGLGWNSKVEAVGDGLGSMLVAWRGVVDSTAFDIRAAKVTANGLLPWGEGINGIRVVPTTGPYLEVDICVDQATNGFYLMWEEQDPVDRTFHNFVQRVDSEGGSMWDSTGIELFGSGESISSFRLSPSMVGGVQDGLVIAGLGVRSDEQMLIAQKVLADGGSIWNNEGVEVCDASYHHNPRDLRVISDFEGGCLLLWERHNVDDELQFGYLRAARLNENGEQLWGDCGLTIHRSQFGSKFRGEILYVPQTDYARVYFMDYPFLGYKSVAFEDGSGISELPVLIHRQVYGETFGLETISMGNNSAALIWGDGRGYGGDLHYQIVDASGQFRFADNGVPLAPQLEGEDVIWQGYPAACPNGDGGFFAAFFVDWHDRELRVVHVDSDGVPSCTESGVLIADSVSTNAYKNYIAADGTGGCYIAWTGLQQDFTEDIFIQRLDPNCETIWPEPVRLETSGDPERLASLTPTSDGGCVVTWHTGGIVNDWDLPAAKISSTGIIEWSVMVSNQDGGQESEVLVPDTEGGVYIAWRSYLNEPDDDGIYVQHLDAEGNALWQSGGYRIGERHSYYPMLVLDEINGLYVVWKHQGIRAQKLDLMSGAPLWGDSGIVVIDVNVPTDLKSVTPNEEGGFFCVWGQSNFPQVGLYGMDIRPDGTPTDEYWLEGSGGLIYAGNRTAWGASAVPFGDGTTLVGWTGVIYGELAAHGEVGDKNEYYYRDVYAQRIATGPVLEMAPEAAPVPGRYALHQNYPNPFNPNTAISFELAQAGAVSLVVYDLLGRTVASLIDRPMTVGAHSLEWDAGSLPSGVYIYRLQAGEFASARKMVLLR